MNLLKFIKYLYFFINCKILFDFLDASVEIEELSSNTRFKMLLGDSAVTHWSVFLHESIFVQHSCFLHNKSNFWRRWHHALPFKIDKRTAHYRTISVYERTMVRSIILYWLTFGINPVVPRTYSAELSPLHQKMVWIFCYTIWTHKICF